MMRRARESIWSKFIAMTLLVVSVALFAGSVFGIVAMESAGVYDREKSEVQEEWNEEICRSYSVLAMSGYEEDFNLDYLDKNTNFQFGVIQTSDRESVDLNDKRNYLVRNFTGKVDLEDMVQYSCSINEDTTFHISDELFSGSYIQNDFYTGAVHVDTRPVKKIYYAVNSGNVYVQTEEGELYESICSNWIHDKTVCYYVQEDGEIECSDDRLLDIMDDDADTQEAVEDFSEDEFVAYAQEMLGDDCYLLSIRKPEDARGDYQYEWKKPGRTVEVWPGSFDFLRDIEPVSDTQLAELGEVAGWPEEMCENNQIRVYVEIDPKEYGYKDYYVVSKVKEPLVSTGNWKTMDLFARADMLLNFAYDMRMKIVAVMLAAFVLMLASFGYLLYAAGHHKGCEGITPYLLDKAPLDLYLAVDSIILWILALGVYLIGQAVWHTFTSQLFWALASCAAVAGIVILAGYAMSLAVNVKLGKWWHNTLIYLALRWCFRVCKRIWRGFSQLMREILGGISMLWKAWLLFGLMLVFDLFVYADSYIDGELLILCLLEKFIIFVVVTWLVSQLSQLQRGAARIASGEADYRIDTSRMSAEAKRHGEYLNDIGTGINHAVSERLKSERFKTELITNVSHDIKTPLTSIINYVDLLQKEQIDNPKAVEYLEVLDRQSARLKKLIEDLIEASKASTGNLNVIMEKCDVGVMLSQTLGEFEERLLENQIELCVQGAGEKFCIEADSRHMWRVFDNLMNNICKYSQPGTRAYINVEQCGAQVAITFRNISKSRLNISSEELKERFVRGDSSRNTEGSGLGLSIAISLTNLMNGSLELTVDGDLFKVILAFPAYGSKVSACNDNADSGRQTAEDGSGAGDRSAQDRRRESGVAFNQTLQAAGAGVGRLGRKIAGRGRRFARRTGQFVQGVRQVAANLDDGQEDDGTGARDE